jgi:hypothetical protein
MKKHLFTVILVIGLWTTQSSAQTNTPTSTPTGTPTLTPTITNTPTRTATSTRTNTPTKTHTNTKTPTPTSTLTNTPTQTRTPTTTNTPAPTSTVTPTSIPVECSGKTLNISPSSIVKWSSVVTSSAGPVRLFVAPTTSLVVIPYVEISADSKTNVTFTAGSYSTVTYFQENHGGTVVRSLPAAAPICVPAGGIVTFSQSDSANVSVGFSYATP